MTVVLPDELPNTASWQNLWRTNSLEVYRDNSSSGGSESSRFPKVLITVRTDFLWSNMEYKRSFLPVDVRSEDKDKAHDEQQHLRVIRV